MQSLASRNACIGSCARLLISKHCTVLSLEPDMATVESSLNLTQVTPAAIFK